MAESLAELDLHDDGAAPAPVVEKSKLGNETWIRLVRPAVAEGVGSMLFMFLSLGAAMNTAVSFTLPGPQQISIALSFGLVVFVIAFSIGHISGGHLNPAVTLSFWITRKISAAKALAYWSAQCLGGMLGAALLRGVSPDAWLKAPVCLGNNALQDGVTPGMAFGVEVVTTAFLLLVVHAAADTAKSNQVLVPLAIGMAVSVVHFMSMHVDGTSINPMRSLSSAVGSSGIAGCTGVWNDHWVFWLGPLIGGVLGGFLYENLFVEGTGLQNTLEAMYKQNRHDDRDEE